MKQYKVVTAKTPEKSEELMNQYAENGWIVKSVNLWETAMSYQIMITFEKDCD